MRTPLILLFAVTLAACSGTTPQAAPTPTAAAVSKTPAPVVPDRLRPITGAQVCAALPKGLRKSLVPGNTLGRGVVWSGNVATATQAWGSCDWHFGSPHSLYVSVEAHGTATQTATDYAKQLFDEEKAEAGGSVPPVAEDYGDTAFSVTGSDMPGGSRNNRYVEMLIRQGPWLIRIRYRGHETSGEFPPTAELRRGAGKVAEVFTAEMAKDPSTVAADHGLCGALSTADVSSIFFPSVVEVSGERRNSGTTCVWAIQETFGRTGEEIQRDNPCDHVSAQPGDRVSRCGRLRISVTDYGGRDRRERRIGFDAMTERYAEDAPIERLTGIGDRAFAFVDQVHVLAGRHRLFFTYDGANIGGGVREAPGYQAPNLDEAALRKSLTRIAEIFVPNLSVRA